MAIFQTIVVVATGMGLAVAFERLIRQYSKRLKDDCLRMSASQEALARQRRLVDAVVENPSIPFSVKTFVVDVSSVIPEQTVALKIADWVDEDMPPHRSAGTDSETDAIFDSLRELNRSHPEAFELVVSSLRGAFVTTLIQWPATAAALLKFAHQIYSESTTEVTASAAAVHRAAKSNHWMDGDNVVPA